MYFRTAVLSVLTQTFHIELLRLILLDNALVKINTMMIVQIKIVKTAIILVKDVPMEFHAWNARIFVNLILIINFAFAKMVYI
jgi:hypothetical protein